MHCFEGARAALGRSRAGKKEAQPPLLLKEKAPQNRPRVVLQRLPQGLLVCLRAYPGLSGPSGLANIPNPM